MSERKLSGNDMLLFLDPDGGTSYSTVVCLTSQSYDRSRNVIDATSKCGPDSLSGIATRSIKLDGMILYDPETGSVSENDLDDIFEAGSAVGWKMAEVTPVAGSVVLQGTGLINELSSSFGKDEVSTFSATITITGTPTKTLVPDTSSATVDTGTIGATSAVIEGLASLPANFNDEGLIATISVQAASAPLVNITTPVTRTFSGDDDGLFLTPYTQPSLTTATAYIAKVVLNYGGTITKNFTTS